MGCDQSILKPPRAIVSSQETDTFALWLVPMRDDRGDLVGQDALDAAQAKLNQMRELIRGG